MGNKIKSNFSVDDPRSYELHLGSSERNAAEVRVRVPLRPEFSGLSPATAWVAPISPRIFCTEIVLIQFKYTNFTFS